MIREIHNELRDEINALQSLYDSLEANSEAFKEENIKIHAQLDLISKAKEQKVNLYVCACNF